MLELFRAADASILSSSWENFPHGVVESLAVGTPVIATAVGGVAEVVDATARTACSSRAATWPRSRRRSCGTSPSRARGAAARERRRLGRALQSRRACTDGSLEILSERGSVRRVLFVGRTRYSRPLASTHARKFDALGELLDLRVLGTAGAGSGDLPGFTLLDGPLFYARARSPSRTSCARSGPTR